MKQITIFLFFVTVSSLVASFDFFSDNPAFISNRNYKEMKIPGFNFQIHANNSLLQFDDLNIFQENRLIQPSEKKKLTSDDLIIQASCKMSLFHYGYKNWDFSYTLLGFAEGEILEKEYAKLILYGNEEDDYETTNGENAEGVVFSKAAITYGHPNPVHLRFLQSSKKNNFAYFRNFLSEIPIFIGTRLNFYYPFAYGYVPYSHQEFGSSYLETYGTYQIRYYQTDSSSSAKLSLGTGFGFNAILPDGNFSFYIDDLFSTLRYENLKAEYREGVYQDSLTHFEDDHETINETYSEEYRVAKKTMRIHPTIEIGYEHFFHDQFSMIVQYKNSMYDYMNGLSLGLDYRLVNHIPLQFITGKEKSLYFEIKSGYIGKNIEFMIASTFYYGMFRYAKGLGLKLGVTYKFQ